MKVIIQRVTEASVLIDNNDKENISKGFMILLGITYNDSMDDIDYLVKKIMNLRIFEHNNKMDLSISDINGEILLIPQFTLYADCKKGNRPSFKDVLAPSLSKPLFELFISKLNEFDINIKTGKFGSDMKVSLINDGPVTIILDSKER